MNCELKVALVLASGGAKGFAHIGAIEELERRGYTITSVAGTSMGALIGGIYAAGGLSRLKEWFFQLDNAKIWNLLDFQWSLNSLVKGEKLMDAMKEVVPDVNIQDLRIPFCAVATDLKTGSEVILDEGSLYDAMRASISLPLVFSQVENNGRLLVDGGLVNGLPLNRVKRHPGDLLVAVNLDNYEWHDPSQVNTEGRFAKLRSKLSSMSDNYFNLLDRSLTISMRQNVTLALQQTPPDIYLNVDMGPYDSFDYDNAREIAQLGQEQMAALLKDLPPAPSLQVGEYNCEL